MSNTTQKITMIAFHLQRLMRHKVVQEAELGKDISLLHLELLGFVTEKKGLTMKELADMLKITAPSATSLVDRLVKMGFIERTQDKTNRRLVRLQVTKKGKTIFERDVRKSQEVVTKLLSILTEKDQQDMLRIYEKLVSSLTS